MPVHKNGTVNINTKQSKVIMRSLVMLSVLAGGEKSNFIRSNGFTKTLQKKLNFALSNRTISGKMIFIIGKS